MQRMREIGRIRPIFRFIRMQAHASECTPLVDIWVNVGPTQWSLRSASF